MSPADFEQVVDRWLVGAWVCTAIIWGAWAIGRVAYALIEVKS